MKRIILKYLLLGFLFCFSVSLTVSSQEFVDIKNIETVQAEINKTAEAIKTIKSRFVQEKHLSFLTEPISSEGLFRYKKENQLRWEYTSPFQYLILFNGNKIIIKDQKKVNEFDANSNAVFKQINDLMLGAVKGDLGKNDKFITSLKESSKQYLLLLVPQDEVLKAYISEVEIYFEKSDLAVSSLKIIEATGDFTKIIFNDRKFNETIDNTTFDFN